MHRTEYVHRLQRIEGQVRGLKRMIENDEYCIDVLTQISSVTAALQGVGIGLVDEHLRHCVMEAAIEGDAKRDITITEAVRAVERLVRS
ncbi:MAG: metal-sensitive transcriptional regulator [Ilumatobacteraceae bacterium]